MEIRALDTSSFETLFEAFSQAFADYELQLDSEQLRAMLKRRGFDASLSFAAFDGDRIASFTCNGIGSFNEIPTAYDTGTGTLKAYRGKGLATDIFQYSIPYLKKRGVTQYLLEVLEHNTKAVSVYRNIGFETVRTFSYAMQRTDEIRNEPCEPRIPITVKRIGIEQLSRASDFWDFYPSWQNSFESIKRAEEGFVCLGAYSAATLTGYGVFEPVSGDITQLAVAKQHRRKGIASLLLNEMVRLNSIETVKALNTDVLCLSMAGFLKAKNITVKGQQLEMMKQL